MGFTNSEINSIGYINAARVVRIIDDSSALIEVSLVDPTTDLPADVNGGTPIKRTLLIEGVPTKVQAEDNFWKLESWFKVIDTKKLDGTTYFVVWQVLQAGRASTK